MGAVRKTMVYLGLAEDQRRYEDEYYDDYAETGGEHDAEHEAEVTPIHRRQEVAHLVRPVDRGGVSRITTIHPRTYNEAKTIGENFREGIPVIMNLTDMGDADAKRLVDFAAGLVFGLHGSIERVTAKVFLLSPATVEVSASDGAPPRAIFNQS